MRRILVAAAVIVLGSLVSVASPAQAASGPWSVVSAGVNHTCAINTGKSLYCWGINDEGQIGDGTSGLANNRHAPKKIGTSGVWASVAAGRGHTCAVTTGRSLYCWGSNFHGQVGDGTTAQRPAPKRIGTSGVWASVDAGGLHTCAVTTGKSLYCWGFNFFGQVGDGTGDTRLSPKRIGSTGVWGGVTAADLHTCATTTGRSLYCWGYNAFGSVGDGTDDQRPSPRKIGSTGVWALVAAGDVHTCAITTAQSLYCWGANGYGQVGDGTTNSPRSSPKKIGTSGVWARAATGGDGSFGHTCATTTSNSLYCWGYNEQGQVGDGTTNSPRSSPRKIGTSGVWAASTAGGLHSCAITTAKSLYCWGLNQYGQIGDGTTTQRPSPRRVA